MADRSVQSQQTVDPPAFVVRDAAEDGSQSDQDSRQTIGGFTIIEPEQSAASSEDRITVQQPVPRSRRCSICGGNDHTARTCQAEGTAGFATRASRRPSKEAVGSVAPMIVGTLNFCAVTTFGQESALTELEAKLLIPSTQRMFERLPAAAAQKASIIIDPLVILTVIGMWIRRIATIQDQKAKEKYLVRPEEQARANGVADTVYSVSPEQRNEKTTSTSSVIPPTYPTTSTPPPPSANGIPTEILGSFERSDF